MTTEPAPAADKAAATPAATPVNPEPAEQQIDQKQDKPKKVDFGSPEANARFTEVYHGYRQNERRAKALATQNEQLMAKLTEIGGKVEKIEGAAQADNIADLKAQLSAATERADARAVTELTDRLVEARVAEAKPKAPVLVPVEPAGDGGLSRDEMSVFQSWVEQTDPNGVRYRPWAQEGHPKQRTVASIVASVLDDPEFDGQTMQVKLREADRRIVAVLVPRKAAPAADKTPTVLPGGTVKTPKGGDVTLTDDQKMVAERMFLNVKTLSGKVVAKTAAEAHTRYAQQLKAMQ